MSFKALALRLAKPLCLLLRALDILLPATEIEKGVKLVVAHLQKACAAHGYSGTAVTAGEPHHAEIDREYHGGMVFHYTYFAVKSAAGERRIIAGFKLLFGREDVNGKGFFAVRSCRLPSDQSVFAFQIENYTFVEFSHNGSLRVWLIDDAPEIFGEESIDAGEIRSDYYPVKGKIPHLGDWQLKVDDWMYKNCHLKK